MENFTQLHYIIGTILLGYGIVLGFKNTFARIISIILFWKCTFTQNYKGRLLDSLFYAGIGYLTLVYYGSIA